VVRRSVMGDVRTLRNMDDDEIIVYAKRMTAPYNLIMQTPPAIVTA